MKKLFSLLVVILIAIWSAQPVRADYTQAFPSLTFETPVILIPYPGESNTVVVGEIGGKAYRVTGSGSSATKELFFDLSNSILVSGEQGLLSIAFDPNFVTNGYLYIHHSGKSDGRTMIVRYKVTNGIFSKSSRTVFLQVKQPYENHKGGSIVFGADGFLYIALGDGGSGGDPLSNGQSTKTMLGKILRIDVSKKSSGKRYSIPKTNPFKGSKTKKEEIYAYGFRNPWRMNFDSVTGKLWAGDVGQGNYEEIDLVARGKNYGWKIREGNHCFFPSSGCKSSGLTKPIYEYSHSVGSSITGGYVYRGTNLPNLVGKYIYGDFVTGKIWSLTKSGSTYQAEQLVDTDKLIASFGVDAQNELYVLDYGNSQIYKLEDLL